MLVEAFASSGAHFWASLITDDEQYTEYYQLDGETKVFTEYYDVLSDPWRLTNTLGDDDPRNDPDPLTVRGCRLSWRPIGNAPAATAPSPEPDRRPFFRNAPRPHPGMVAVSESRSVPPTRGNRSPR
jgi:hypothetical protein